jgi:23S rRNA (guanosine2251-2'-O)-methyltransferase
VAGAMNVTCVIAPKDNSTGITPIVRKVACGGAEIVPFVQVVNLARIIKFLKEQNVWVYGAKAACDNTLYNFEFPRKVAVVLGSEGSGLRQLTEKMCDNLISLPLNSAIDSLNVSVATGIFLYEITRQKAKNN